MLLNYLIRHTKIRRNTCIRNYNIQCVFQFRTNFALVSDILLILL